MKTIPVLALVFLLILLSPVVDASGLNEICSQIATAFSFTTEYENFAMEDLKAKTRLSKIDYLTSPLAINGYVSTGDTFGLSLDVTLSAYDGGLSRYERENAYLAVEGSKIRTLLAAREFMFSRLSFIIQLKMLESQFEYLRQLQGYYAAIGLESAKLKLEEERIILYIKKMSSYLYPLEIDLKSFELGVIDIPSSYLNDIDIEAANLTYQLRRIAKSRNEHLEKVNDNFKLDVVYSVKIREDLSADHTLKLSAKLQWGLNSLLNISSTLDVTPSQLTTFSHIRSTNVFSDAQHWSDIILEHRDYIQDLSFLYQEHALLAKEKKIVEEELMLTEQILYPLTPTSITNWYSVISAYLRVNVELTRLGVEFLTHLGHFDTIILEALPEISSSRI